MTRFVLLIVMLAAITRVGSAQVGVRRRFPLPRPRVPMTTERPRRLAIALRRRQHLPITCLVLEI